MIDFPEITKVHRRLPKTAFYQHLALSNKVKDSFVSDIEALYFEYSLTADNLHLNSKGRIKEITVLLLELKTDKYNPKLLEEISKQNPHRIIYILNYQTRIQFAFYYRKLYTSPWQAQDKADLFAIGSNLDIIWDNLQLEIASPEDIKNYPDYSVLVLLERRDRIHGIEKKIIELEKMTEKEQQPKKKFEYYSKTQEYKKKLEDIKNGQIEDDDEQ